MTVGKQITFEESVAWVPVGDFCCCVISLNYKSHEIKIYCCQGLSYKNADSLVFFFYKHDCYGNIICIADYSITSLGSKHLPTRERLTQDNLSRPLLKFATST